MDIAQRVESLGRKAMRVMIANGEGKVITDYSTPISRNEPVIDYFILLGKVPSSAIQRYLTKVKIGGIIAAEVGDRDAEDVRQLVTFYQMVANQRAYSYFVDGVKYLFIVRLEV